MLGLFWSLAGHVVYAMSFLMFACMMTDAMVPPLCAPLLFFSWLTGGLFEF